MPAASVMKISELLNKARKDKKLLEAEVLLAHVLGESREWVLSHDREEVSSEDMRRFHELWVRLNEGEPLAYLVKKKEFYGHDFYVDKRVLVPRPETELLVEEVLRLSGDARFANKKNVRIIDVGTGSGVIAVSLAKSSDRLEVLATEFSEGAHEVAKENCKGLSGKCGFGTKFIPICARQSVRKVYQMIHRRAMSLLQSNWINCSRKYIFQRVLRGSILGLGIFWSLRKMRRSILSLQIFLILGLRSMTLLMKMWLSMSLTRRFMVAVMGLICIESFFNKLRIIRWRRSIFWVRLGFRRGQIWKKWRAKFSLKKI